MACMGGYFIGMFYDSKKAMDQYRRDYSEEIKVVRMINDNIAKVRDEITADAKRIRKNCADRGLRPPHLEGVEDNDNDNA